MITYVKRIVFLVVCMSSTLYALTPSFTHVYCHDATLQSDDSALVVGNGIVDGKSHALIARYLKDGSLDTTFNGTGIVATNVGDAAQFDSVVLQSDGSIVVVGQEEIAGENYLLLARYTSSGDLDTTFNGTGLVSYLAGDGLQGSGVALQSDGKILVSGTIITNGKSRACISRWNVDGSLDTSYADGGFRSVVIGSRSSAHALSIDDIDRAVIIGQAVVSGQNSFLIVRLSDTGILDATFGTDGITTTSVSESCLAHDLALQLDGSYVVVGCANQSICVVRYDNGGSLDSSFASNGIGMYSVSLDSSANSVAVQADDSIIVSGISDHSFVTIRLKSDGAIDTPFGKSGSAYTSFARYDEAHAVLLQSDDSLLVVGQSDYDCVLVRYLATGEKDTTYGSDGQVIQPSGTFLGANRLTTLCDAQSTGTNGGTFNNNGWRTRTLNTIVGNRGNISLANNQFTLQPGTYDITITAPAYRVGNHQARLQNITCNSTEKYGTCEYSHRGSQGSMSSSVIEARISLAQATLFEVQHYCDRDKSSDGFGIATGFSDKEIYTQVKIVKI